MNHAQRVKAIETRISTRTFENSPFQPADLDQVRSYITDSQNLVGPFGHEIKADLVLETANTEKEIIGTYGFIQSAQGYIIGSGTRDTRELFDFAFVLENIVLYLTALGISTCWLGGRFRKKEAMSQISLEDNEIIPAIVAIGYSAEKARPKEKMIRRVLQARKRKPPEQLFFYETFEQPLRERGGNFQQALHYVRIAPSAQNKQPWRLLFNSDLSRADFYTTSPLDTHPLYMCDPAYLDIGIAFNHFQTGLDGAGIKGKLIVEDPDIEIPEGYSYITSWIRE